MSRFQGWLAALVCAAILGALSLAADYIWFYAELKHTTVNGLVHGALLFLAMGAVLGFAWGTSMAKRWSAPISLGIGLAAAGAFYVLFPVLGWDSMIAAWMLLWPMFAFLRRYVLFSLESFGMTLLRGLAAAVLSGAVFYLILGIWSDPPEGGPEPIRFFLSWTAAFLPGMVFLVVETRPAKME